MSTKVLRVETRRGFKVGSGIGLRATAAPTVGVTQQSFKTQVASLPGTNVLVPTVEFPRSLVGKTVTITSDDSLPIQAAIDSLGTRGGTVVIPAGTYVIGSPGYWNNQAISVGSRTTLLGAGPAATIFQLCDEANFPVPHAPSVPASPTGAREATNGDYGLGAGPMIVNRSNPWYRPSSDEVDFRPPWYGLAHDTDIKISGIGSFGNQDNQSATYEPMYQPVPESPSGLAATQSVIVNEGIPADLTPPSSPGNLVAGETYVVYVRYMDSAGIEGPPSNPAVITLAADGDALVVTIPPLPPENATALVVYVSAGELLNDYGDLAYERNQVVSPIPVWDLSPLPAGPPAPSSWPTVTVLNHTPYTRTDPAAGYRLPGLLQIGESTAGNFAFFYNVKGLELTELAIEDFVVDGITLGNIEDGVFSSMRISNNGRDAVSIGQQFNSNLTFHDCTWTGNGQAGVDMEDMFACKKIEFTDCSIIDNTSAGMSIGLQYASGNPPADNPVEDVTVSRCTFTGNFRQIFVNVGGPTPPSIENLVITNCTFSDNANRCIWVQTDNATVPITGTISGCTFSQASGQPQNFGPNYNVTGLPNGVPCIWLVGAPIVFEIVENSFMPFGAMTSVPSPPAPEPFSYLVFTDQAMIDVSLTAGGHVIKGNTFASNPIDNRPEAILLASAPAQVGSNVYREGLTRSWFGGGSEDQGWKHQWFLAADQNAGPQDEFPILASCAVDANSGDGYIVVNPNMPTDSGEFQPLCGLRLREAASNVPLAEGTTSFDVYVGSPGGFQAQLPGTWSIPTNDPPIAAQGAYEVAVTFTDFDPGPDGWTLTEKGPNGFAIAWDTPVPAATMSSTPQVSWSATFVTA